MRRARAPVTLLCATVTWLKTRKRKRKRDRGEGGGEEWEGGREKNLPGERGYSPKEFQIIAVHGTCTHVRRAATGPRVPGYFLKSRSCS